MSVLAIAGEHLGRGCHCPSDVSGSRNDGVLLLKTVVKCWDREKTKPFMVRLEGSGRPS